MCQMSVTLMSVTLAEVEALVQFSAFIETTYRLWLAKATSGTVGGPLVWNWLRFERTRVNIMPFVFFAGDRGSRG